MSAVEDLDAARAHLGVARDLLREVTLRARALRHDVEWATSAAEPVRRRLDDSVRLVDAASAELEEWDRAVAQQRARALAEAGG